MKTKTRRTKYSTIFILLFIILFTSTSFAEDLTFTWTANTETVTGYKIYYKTGAESGSPYEGAGLVEGASPITVGDVTTYTVTGRDVNETYHFVITAYNDLGESEFATPVTVSPLDSTPPDINSMRYN